MGMARFVVGTVLVLWLALSAPVMAGAIASTSGALRVEQVLAGLTEPWSLAFLPDGRFLVSERGGRLLLANRDGGKVVPVRGLPQITVVGQGGLLDVLVPQDFARTGEIVFSFVKTVQGRPVTALAAAHLDLPSARLSRVRVLFEMRSPSAGGRHFGGRIVEARDGRLFLTLGERGARDQAQNLANHNGVIVRINRDGSVPADNPFVKTAGARPEIWSYGHRNPQGAALDLAGQLWVDEHGAKGGDEINRIRRGANFGWPVIAYGVHYSGAKIGEGTHKAGMEQPAHYWDPSIAPSGLMIYSGRLWPQWRGHFFVGSLKFGYIARLDQGAGWREEALKSAETGRVRDIREAPDGSIWFVSVSRGALYRITPK